MDVGELAEERLDDAGIDVAHADPRGRLAELVDAEPSCKEAVVERGLIVTDVTHDDAAVDHNRHGAVARYRAVAGDQLELGAGDEGHDQAAERDIPVDLLNLWQVEACLAGCVGTKVARVEEPGVLVVPSRVRGLGALATAQVHEVDGVVTAKAD